MTQDAAAPPHPFDQALALAPQGEHRFAGQPHPGYANFAGPYGGMTAAQVLQAVLMHPARLGEPVALTVNYGAALRDAPFFIDARPARTNRSTQHWLITLTQPGESGAPETMITATAVTGVRRRTWGTVDAAMPADVPRPRDVARLEAPSFVRWLERYEFRPVSGGFPTRWDGGDSGGSVTRIWVRDAPARPLDFASLTALSDTFYPRLWLRRATMTPIATVSLTTYFHAGAAELAATGDGYVLGQARAQAFFNGYHDQSGALWNECGQLLATTHQIVYFKE